MRTKNILTTIILLIALGCAHHGIRFQAYCRHEAVLCCMVLKEHSIPCRIAVGVWNENPIFWHAQAQAFVDGKWVFVHLVDRYVVETKQDNFTIKYYFTLRQFIEMYRMISNIN